MHDPIIGRLDPVAARNELAGLHSRGTATPEDEAAARAKLATAKIDKAIRDSMAACPGPLHPAQVDYLIGRIREAGEKAQG